MKQYTVNLSNKGIQEAINKLQSLKTMFNSIEFMQYLGNKCKQTLDEVTSKNMSGDESNMVKDYVDGHQLLVNVKEIILYNNTTDNNLDGMSENTKANYPNGFSIAKAVEYGVGIVGASSAGAKEAKDWQYDLNNHNTKGWFYKTSNGLYAWSMGYEGRLIYLKTKLEIEQHIPQWIEDYINNNLK